MQPHLAILIDGDNVAAESAPAILAHATELGRPMVKRVYGKPAAMTNWADFAHEQLYELRPQAGVAAAKNGTDIALTIEAMDLLHVGVVQAFCIVSNDRDFVPLAIRLRGAGKRVYVICRQGDERLTKAFDTVLELDTRDPIVEAFRKIVRTKARS